MSEHTPTPWHVMPQGFSRQNTPTVYAADSELRYIAVCNDQLNIIPTNNLANAEFIVRACNSFDGLLAACKRQVANIEKWLETGVPAWPEESESIYNQMVEAIANAEGKQQCKK